MKSDQRIAIARRSQAALAHACHAMGAGCGSLRRLTNAPWSTRLPNAPPCRPLSDLSHHPLTVSELRFHSVNSDRLETMDFTLGEAARQCGVAKGTISKAIKTGKLSATRREDGSWKIDNGEIARYLEANQHRFGQTP
jgi:excisionase family DNA binding protein